MAPLTGEIENIIELWDFVHEKGEDLHLRHAPEVGGKNGTLLQASSSLKRERLGALYRTLKNFIPYPKILFTDLNLFAFTVLLCCIFDLGVKRKIRTRLDLLSIPQSGPVLTDSFGLDLSGFRLARFYNRDCLNPRSSE